LRLSSTSISSRHYEQRSESWAVGPLREDAVADAFIKVFDKIRTFDKSRPFEPWLYRLVVNTAIDHSRLARRESTFAEVIDEAGTVDFDLRLEVATAIKALPPHQRAVVVLRYCLDFDEKSISDSPNPNRDDEEPAPPGP